MPPSKSTFTTERVNKAVSSIDRLGEAMGKLGDSRKGARGALKEYKQELQEVRKAAGEAGGALEKTASTAKVSLGGALKGLVEGGLRAAGILQTLSLVNAVEEAKKLELATAKLGQSAGTSGTVLRRTFDAMESRTLTSAGSMTELARALGRTTHDAQFAAASVGAIGDEALAVGRDIGDELPLAAALHDMGVQADGLTGELGRLRDIAERVGTVGGQLALKDTLAALAPVLQTVSTQTDESRAKLEALVAVLGKGLPAQQAQAAAGGVLGALKARAVDFERITGRRVVDDKGQLIDPTQTLKDLKAYVDRKYGKRDSRSKRLALQQEGELGFAMLRGGLDDVDSLAGGARDRGKTSAEAEAFRQSKEGQRIETQLARNQAMRGIGSTVLGAQDLMVKALGANTTALISLGLGLKGMAGGFGLGGGAAGAGAGVAGAGVAGAATVGAAGAAGESATLGLIASVGGLGAAAATAGIAIGSLVGTLKVLHEIGQDRDEMGKNKREEWSDDISDENRLKQGDRPEDVEFDRAIRRGKKSLESTSWLDSLFGSGLSATPEVDLRSKVPSTRELVQVGEDAVNEEFEVVTTTKVRPRAKPNATKGNSAKGGR